MICAPFSIPHHSRSRELSDESNSTKFPSGIFSHIFMDSCCGLGTLNVFATFMRTFRSDMEGRTRNACISTTSSAVEVGRRVQRWTVISISMR